MIGIIFDLDNTLVHSRIDFAAIRRELGAVLDRAGALRTPIAAEGPLRLSIGQIIELGREHDDRHGSDLAPYMWQIVESYEREGLHMASVERDARPTLAELRRRNHALGVLTNNSRRSALEALRKFGMIPYLDPILGREDTPAMKPSSSGLLLAMQRLGARASRLVMVGDSYLDGLAATEAGCPFVAFRPRPGEMEARQITPMATITDLGELLGLL